MISLTDYQTKKEVKFDDGEAYYKGQEKRDIAEEEEDEMARLEREEQALLNELNCVD